MATNFLEFSRFFSIRVENCRKSSIFLEFYRMSKNVEKKILDPGEELARIQGN